MFVCLVTKPNQIKSNLFYKTQSYQTKYNHAKLKLTRSNMFKSLFLSPLETCTCFKSGVNQLLFLIFQKYTYIVFSVKWHLYIITMCCNCKLTTPRLSLEQPLGSRTSGPLSTWILQIAQVLPINWSRLPTYTAHYIDHDSLVHIKEPCSRYLEQGSLVQDSRS